MNEIVPWFTYACMLCGMYTTVHMLTIKAKWQCICLSNGEVSMCCSASHALSPRKQGMPGNVNNAWSGSYRIEGTQGKELFCCQSSSLTITGNPSDLNNQQPSVRNTHSVTAAAAPELSENLVRM